MDMIFAIGGVLLVAFFLGFCTAFVQDYLSRRKPRIDYGTSLSYPELHKSEFDAQLLTKAGRKRLEMDDGD